MGWATPLTCHSHFSIEDVNIHGARVIAEACRQAGVERLVHVSALGADLQSPSHFLRAKVGNQHNPRTCITLADPNPGVW